jgi:very-short-patch-repair endonuclease
MPNSRLTERARNLRKDDTQAETRLWQALRNRKLGGWKWRRQVPRGPYIVDFFCAEAKLVVEVDGATHSSEAEVAYDLRRTAFLEEEGLTVFRITNHGVFEDLQSVCLAILALCDRSTPSPS